MKGLDQMTTFQCTRFVLLFTARKMITQMCVPLLPHDFSDPETDALYKWGKVIILLLLTSTQ